MAISGTGLAASAVGIVFLWSAVKGASISETLRSLMQGKEPTGDTVHAIDAPAAQAVAAGGATVAAGAAAGALLAIAASFKGEKYCFGGGHGSSPAPAGSCTDCSGYVSQVLNKVGVMKGTMATGGLAKIGSSVPYAQRQPGDIIVWTSGATGHCGIIIDGSTMWNNPCTACGGVQIGHYPYGTRTAAAAIIRRV